MNDKYCEFRRREYIRPLELTNKEKFYADIMNIEYSFSGIIGNGQIINTFILEAAQELINAIELFEMGYFDCAYYSLRSAVELSTTMVFLTDMPEEERNRYLENWKDTKQFPMQSQIVQMLSEKGDVFADMLDKIPSFFENAKKLTQELNKYVHKQGLKHFYISRNHPINLQKPLESFINEFESYLKKCIGVVAVMRLAGDAFPILLMDEEFLLRCFDSMTASYTPEFVDEYIGNNILNAYKETLLYQRTYDAFSDDEKKNYATFNVMKHQYIDRNKMSDIMKQLHLLNNDDSICVLMVNACDKITKTYAIGGFQMYFTDKDTARKAYEWKGSDFKRFENNSEKLNQPYDEVFISVFECLGKNYFAEHNEPLSEREIAAIKKSLSNYEKTQKEYFKDEE